MRDYGIGSSYPEIVRQNDEDTGRRGRYSSPLLMYDSDRPGDASGKPHSITHITDALRYFAVSGQPAPSRSPAKAAGKLIERLKGR